MSKNILHIANNFTINVLYDELISRLEKKNLNNMVIASTFTISNSIYYYEVHQCLRSNNILNRLRFKNKIKKLWHFTESKINLANNIDLVHAHTLFSDGAIAYRAFQKYHIPYIVAIRNTDINVFFKYFFHLRRLGKQILKNASRIILISPIYLNKLKKYLTPEEFQNLSHKIEVIPNGIGDIWLNNPFKNTRSLHTPIRLIFCGSFDNNKNILRIIDAANQINRTKSIELKLIGVKPSQSDKYVESVRKTCSKSNIKTEILERMPHKELISHYRESDIFIMPSHTETFGLVYVEALSQGLPIIYTKREGFDGFFKDGTIGLGVNSHSTNDIAINIEKIIENYDFYSQQVANTDLSQFSWDKIAQRYTEIYNTI
ncbi:MAG: glycosyltransferase family 4 protein [Bacteroides sp.]|nr:glycosyltransferase family 4 protein [Bacteroides sp.]